jgi:hypothetical protein
MSLSVPADNDRGPQYMEQALAAIHQANPRRLPIEFSFGIHEQTLVLFCQFPPELAAAVTGQLAAHFPTATIGAAKGTVSDQPSVGARRRKTLNECHARRAAKIGTVPLNGYPRRSARGFMLPSSSRAGR